MSDDDWSDDDSAPSALPPPPPRANLIPGPSRPAIAPVQPAAPAPAPAATPQATSALLVFVPVQLFASGSVQPMVAGASIIEDKQNKQYVCMFYDDRKTAIFAHPLKGTSSLVLDVVAPQQSMLMENSSGRSFRLVFRTPVESFSFISMFCASNALGAAAFAATRFDLRRVVDKKQKSCKVDQYAMFRYRCWQLNELNGWKAEFDPDDTASGTVSERKIPEVSTVFTELLCSMRVGAQKLLVVPSNLDWLSELEESNQNKSFLVLFVELVDVSKKRQLKKKKSKSKAEANDNDEAEDEEPVNEPSVESTAIVPAAAVSAVLRPVEIPSNKPESNSSSESKRTSSTYEPQAANLAEIADVISQARKEMSSAANQCSAHGTMLEKRCLQSFKISLSGLYNQVGAQLVVATGAEPIESGDFDESMLEEKAPLDPKVALGAVKSAIRSAMSVYVESLTAEFDNADDEAAVGQLRPFLAALNTLTSLSKSVTENAMGIPTAFEHLQTAEKHIEQLTAQMKKDQQNKQHELAAKNLETELATLKKTLQKERETAAASAASFNSIQNKLINANSAQDEELEKLRKEKQSLCDQITSLSVFEQGVTDMRTLLDDAVHARDEVEADLDRLASLQKKYNLTWVPPSAVKYCMQCRFKFRFLGGRSKKNCHYCGRVFCDECAAEKIPIPEFGFKEPVRVCHLCLEFKQAVEQED